MDTIFTILNYICMGFALLCGIAGASSFKDYDTWFLLYAGTAVLTCLLYLFCSLPIPYAFAIAGFLVALLNKSKPREGTQSAKHDEETMKKNEQYAKEHPLRDSSGHTAQMAEMASWVKHFGR